MTYTPITEGTQDWADDVNSAFTDLDDRVTLLESAPPPVASGVTSFNTQTGDVTLTLADLGGTTVHNSLSGLTTGDPHTQYLNTTRGDARYPVLDGSGQVDASVLPTGVGQFLWESNLPSQLEVGEVLPQGFKFAAAVTVDRIVSELGLEGRGDDVIVTYKKFTAATQSFSDIVTHTFTDSVSRRETSTGLATSFAIDDRLYIEIEQVGSSQPGAYLLWSIGDDNLTVSSSLSAPSAASGASAVLSGSDILVSWTPPGTSNSYAGHEVHRDGQFFADVPKGTNAVTDEGEASNEHDYDIYSYNTDKVQTTAASASYSPASGISGVTNIGTVAGSGTASATAVVTLDTAVPVGDHVFVLVGSPGALDTWTCIDSQGNEGLVTPGEYDLDRQDGQVGSADAQTCVFSAKVATALNIGDTITVTAATTHQKICVSVWTAHGVDTTAWKDDEAGQYVDTPFSTGWSTGATGAQAATGDLAIGCFYVVKQTNGTGIVTPGGNYQMGTNVQTNVGTSDKQLVPLFQVLSDAAATTMSATGTTGSHPSGSVVTYLAA